MKYLIKNGRCIDPSSTLDAVQDILVDKGVIADCGKKLSAPKDAQVIDAKGLIVAPGFVDMHVHFRTPGREDVETIESGSRAAAKGGYTSVLMMPNTEPAIETPELVKNINAQAQKESLINSYVCAAATKNREGALLNDYKALKAAGALAVSDDGSGIAEDETFRKALRAASSAGLLLIDHCEDKKLSGKGVMHEGFMSSKLGLRGIPAAAEYEMVRRDIEFARGLDLPVHIAHVSCAQSCELIRKAKKAGVRVTAEAAPHHFALTDENCAGYDTRTKMNPPLREASDVRALKEALADGTIDAIATDHAPHGLHDKYVEFDAAAFGVIGLETALSISIMELVIKKVLDWPRLIELMSANPARILGIPAGTLKKGAAADIVIFDPKAQWTYGAAQVESRSKNSPFLDWELTGAVTAVLCGGKQIVSEGKVAQPCVL
jgi:dihydroorotase